MILSVFYPNADIPWLGSPLHLGPKPTHVDPRLPSDNKDPFPVPPPHGLSFQSPSGLLWANEAVLQVGQIVSLLLLWRGRAQLEDAVVCINQIT